MLGIASCAHLISPFNNDSANIVIGMIIASNFIKLTNIKVILHYRLIWRTKCQ
ncbi:hypothetical protein GPLA_1680 [Paraglaciecola polaris LMG 21857]|uniref:Uncharacterized protein n=1 Tax=Paraglaciecola polaris LMG 21857 TaxID=1129793 RepID=K6YIM9_9ALTE|nr:hypothetical protein GPLA_1680 [Paraglaciecola polaris LMG 21857]